MPSWVHETEAEQVTRRFVLELTPKARLVVTDHGCDRGPFAVNLHVWGHIDAEDLEAGRDQATQKLLPRAEEAVAAMREMLSVKFPPPVDSGDAVAEAVKDTPH